MTSFCSIKWGKVGPAVWRSSLTDLQLTCYFLRPSELPNQTADLLSYFSNYTQTAGPTFSTILLNRMMSLMIFMHLSDFLIMVRVKVLCVTRPSRDFEHWGCGYARLALVLHVEQSRLPSALNEILALLDGYEPCTSTWMPDTICLQLAYVVTDIQSLNLFAQ